MRKIDPKYNEYVSMRFDGVKVYWAHLVNPDVAFGGNKWCVDILFDDATAAELEEAGFNIKTLKDKEGKVISQNVICAKKEVTTKNGPNDPPKLYGPDGSAGFDKPIGNGTLCNVNVSAKKWDVSSTITMYIEELQVVELVEKPSESAAFGDTTKGKPKF